MKNLAFCIFAFILTIGTALAQPFSLDKDIKPILLELKENPKQKGTKIVIHNNDLLEDELYYFVKGHDVFDMIDVSIYANNGNPNFKADLTYATWDDIKFSENTKSADNGIINFKFRTYGDFGIHLYPGSEPINFTIAIQTSEPVREYLGSAFRKVSKKELKNEIGQKGVVLDSEETSSNSSSGSNNTWLYVALGVAGLVIALLLGIVLGRRKSASIFALLFLLPLFGFAQMGNGQTWDDPEQYEDWYRNERGKNQSRFEQFHGDWEEGKKRWDDFNGKMGGLLDAYKSTQAVYDAFQNFDACLSSYPPPGMPSMPTFCEDNECANCFIDARERFEFNRYQFEKLRTIYKCTKDLADKSIAFGDNVSGVHGVSGLAWQAERVKIEKSVQELQRAYDKKYAELLQTQLDILSELNDCENQYGIPDWFDRFGKLYFDFTKMNYQRDE